MQSERTVGVRYNSAMRAVLLHEFGGAYKLVYEENVPESTVDSGEVKVRVRACALNHLDIWVRNGIPAYKTPLPHILGSDIAGEVVEVGSGVRGWVPSRSGETSAPSRFPSQSGGNLKEGGNSDNPNAQLV